MTTIRKKALEVLAHRKPQDVQLPSPKISDYFGTNVFGLDAMRTNLASELYKKLEQSIETGVSIDRDVADAVAAAMKSWAMSKGATHYTHWFQPLTGATAEKHDAFFEVQDGRAIERFKGSALVQQEPDASSFPSGGLRTTFEARGYTAWDPTSPAFVFESGGIRTLCIPTIFVSYTGEALDFKAPLLKSLELLDKAAVKVCELFDKDVTKVGATLGPEQEYFLVDKALYMARPDLMLTGRTLFGHASAKGQELEDHYFGSIPERIHHFMMDFEIEAQKLGIPVRTRHNEVAPSQFECAPSFEEINLAVDHNQLLMDVMSKVADRHDLRVLFHEKPFAGVNGSGKHNNWSLVTNTGKNLLGPGPRPKDNLQFLTFFINTIKAVHDYADQLRASIASAGNDHRLGANEAPPAIISVFIGSQLTAILDGLEHSEEVTLDKGDNMYLKLGINKIPEILLDNTDRNRTSPFAFTGNKFEFRAVGASATNSEPMTVLNTAVAHQLKIFRGDVEQAMSHGTKKEVAIVKVLRQYIKASKAIRFEGDGYSQEWEDEAARRGLSNVKKSAHALGFMVNEKAKSLFVDNGIFTERELEARYEIQLEAYIKKLNIESVVLGDLASNHIVPTAVNYQNRLIANAQGLKALGITDTCYDSTVASIREISQHVADIRRLSKAMHEAREEAHACTSSVECAKTFADKVTPFFGEIRYHVDALEMLVDDEEWPMVKYRELLFMR